MQLRARGTSRTPDILFSCPVAIKVPKRILTRPNKITVENTSEKDFVWKMICWIDSKVSKEDSLDHNNEDLH